MTTRKPKAADPVTQATKAATIPKRQVIKHDELFKAELLVARQVATDDLGMVDNTLQTAAVDRDMAIDAADRAYDLACEAALHIRNGAQQMAEQRFAIIPDELDGERGGIIRKLDGIEAALTSMTPAQTNDLKIAAE